MSGTLPVIETTPHATIVAAQTPLDVVNVLLENPAIMSVFKKYAGDPNGLPAALAALLVTQVVAAYGLQLSGTATNALSLLMAAAFGYGWMVFSAKVLTPATPVTKP